LKTVVVLNIFFFSKF